MKALLAVLCVLSIGTLASAEIQTWNCDDDGDGAIVMDDLQTNLTYDSGLDEYTLNMVGEQYSHPAHVEGDFATDTELDPTVWIIETVDNSYTSFVWTDYHINIGMTKTFSITSVIAPDGWTYLITPPALGPIPNGGGSGYVGSVDYYYGGIGTETEIAPGGSGDFGLKVSFMGSVAFCTEQIPTPEPASLMFLAIGGLMLRRRHR